MSPLPCISLSILLLALSSDYHGTCKADDHTLVPGKSLSLSQTIVSEGGAFALGFFFPGNSTRRCYLGIWYNNIPERTVVWVANRWRPLTDPSGLLNFTKDGNIAVLNSGGDALWSSNVTVAVPSIDTAAVLLDSGNFVLRDGDGNYIWQSFDHPTDTLLPTMKLRVDLRTRVGNPSISWRNADDPSPGEFSAGTRPASPFQLAIWRSGNPKDVIWRSGVWNGASITVARETNTPTTFVVTVGANEEEIHISFNSIGGSGLARYVVDTAGKIKLLFMAEDSKNWTTIITFPSKPCDFYGRCGPLGVCDSSGSSAILCKCLHGFVPRFEKDWEAGNFSGGCVRREPLSCREGEWFSAAAGMKLPDVWNWLSNLSDSGCRAECLSRCKCTAYAYANVSSGRWNSSRCLIWEGELVDLEQTTIGGEDLYIRLSPSEVATDAQADVSSKKKLLLVTLLPSFVLVMLLLAAFSYYMKRLRTHGNQETNKAVLFKELKDSSMLVNTKTIEDLPLFNFNAVLDATDNFSASNKLGEGGFGPVYKGKLYQGKEVAVKRLSKVSGQGFEEFRNEVQLIARLQHMNLVSLVGWCIHGDEKILIYEYLPNKSLDKFIFDPSHSTQLDWEKRFRIIQGIAQGLVYLHQHSRIRVIHRDLKTSNILLDSEMNPKISDFGLARILGLHQKEANTRRVVGTFGYMAPEYALDGLFSDKSDVFSFGVIVLEIITGNRSTGFYPYKDSLNLLGYAWQFWKEGRTLELMDPSAGNVLHTHEVLKCVQVALLCIQENSFDRPAMSMVVFMLDNENKMLPSPMQPAFAVGRNAATTHGRSGFQ